MVIEAMRLHSKYDLLASDRKYDVIVSKTDLPFRMEFHVLLQANQGQFPNLPIVAHLARAILSIEYCPPEAQL